MKIFVAGSDTRNCESVCIENKVSKLYSILNEKKNIEQWNDDHLLMVDSGAHSWNKEDITAVGMKRKAGTLPNPRAFMKDYLSFMNTHKHKKLIFVEFDVYGKLPINEVDALYLKFLDLNPVARYLRVYHPILDNGSLNTLRKWISDGHDYIGIGNDSVDLLDKIFSITQDQIRLHGFAMTKMNLLERYPFYSADSTTPISTVIFGNYADKGLMMKGRDEVIAAKSIEIFDDDWARLQKAILKVKQTETYLTKLWTRKGVTWSDDIFA